MPGIIDSLSVLLILGAALAYAGRYLYRAVAAPQRALRDDGEPAGCAATCRLPEDGRRTTAFRGNA